MNDADSRLMRCFKAVFPDLTDEKIRLAVRDSTERWDSLASMLLARTIEDEFGVEADLELLDHLGSFNEVREFVNERAAASG